MYQTKRKKLKKTYAITNALIKQLENQINIVC